MTLDPSLTPINVIFRMNVIFGIKKTNKPTKNFFFFFFLPQICVNGHRDIPSQCVTLIIGIWITSDNFPCPHNNL